MLGGDALTRQQPARLGSGGMVRGGRGRRGAAANSWAAHRPGAFARRPIAPPPIARRSPTRAPLLAPAPSAGRPARRQRPPDALCAALWAGAAPRPGGVAERRDGQKGARGRRQEGGRGEGGRVCGALAGLLAHPPAARAPPHPPSSAGDGRRRWPLPWMPPPHARSCRRAGSRDARSWPPSCRSLAHTPPLPPHNETARNSTKAGRRRRPLLRHRPAARHRLQPARQRGGAGAGDPEVLGGLEGV